MLNYKVKLRQDQVTQESIDWRERYVATDLSYVSGVTDTSYNLGTFESLSVESKAGGGSDIVSLTSNDVRRTGFAVIQNKVYDTHTGKTTNYIVGSSTTYTYLELNGKYYYADSAGTFTIDNWLSYADDEVTEITTSVTMSDSTVKLDTISWIVDDIVTIDGNRYYVDYQTPTPTIRYYENGPALDYSSVTECDGIDVIQLENPTYATEFILTKVDDREVQFDSVGFCDYYFFVVYKNVYCNVVNNGTTYVCNVPNKLIGLEPEDGFSAMTLYSYVEDMGGGTVELSAVTSPIELRDTYAFVKIGNEEVQVNHTVMSANGGPRIIAYLTNDAIVKNLNVGNRISFRNSEIVVFFDVHEYDGEEFVLFNGKRYPLVKNLCDKALLLDYEYDITYPNGKVDAKDALVSIEGEDIPMTLSGGCTMLVPHSLVVTSGSVSAFTQTHYDIKSYDGVVIGGKKYLVHVEEDDDDNVYAKYVVYDNGNNYSMVVEEIIGSSAVVCYPDINSSDFPDDFIQNLAGLVMTSVVYNSGNLSLYVPNTIFGIEPLTPSLAVNRLMNVLEGGGLYIPSSSDEYYNPTDELKIYVNNRYINIPLMFDLNAGGNPYHDNVVETLFYQEEKDKAINRIVDMEHDVYIPKTLVNPVYAGSDSDFNSIEEIQVNLHFRTRDMYNWKVNEEGKGPEFTSGNTNWFITDYYPYHDVADKEMLNSSSDVVGLLYFSNEDIYYQKSRVANSFLRLSYYDSMDPQTQSLLHTSTVFMDEHALYKKYIDNSRKGKTRFINYSTEEITDDNAIITQKISVSSEELSNATPTGYMKITLDDAKRISSRFTIKNKYATDTSSEGFYLYVFKEYGEKLHPKPIYMRVEFNHAGIGQTIPFMKPMRFNNEGNPVSGWTLADDADDLKKGIRLQDFYQQIYIPLYAVYDFKNNEYVYVFDDRYVSVKDGVVTLNLYEIKVMDESDSDPNTEKLKVNRNTQFPEEE